MYAKTLPPRRVRRVAQSGHCSTRPSCCPRWRRDRI